MSLPAEFRDFEIQITKTDDGASMNHLFHHARAVQKYPIRPGNYTYLCRVRHDLMTKTFDICDKILSEPGKKYAPDLPATLEKLKKIDSEQFIEYNNKTALREKLINKTGYRFDKADLLAISDQPTTTQLRYFAWLTYRYMVRYYDTNRQKLKASIKAVEILTSDLGNSTYKKMILGVIRNMVKIFYDENVSHQKESFYEEYRKRKYQHYMDKIDDAIAAFKNVDPEEAAVNHLTDLETVPRVLGPLDLMYPLTKQEMHRDIVDRALSLYLVKLNDSKVHEFRDISDIIAEIHTLAPRIDIEWIKPEIFYPPKRDTRYLYPLRHGLYHYASVMGIESGCEPIEVGYVLSGPMNSSVGITELIFNFPDIVKLTEICSNKKLAALISANINERIAFMDINN